MVRCLPLYEMDRFHWLHMALRDWLRLRPRGIPNASWQSRVTMLPNFIFTTLRGGALENVIADGSTQQLHRRQLQHADGLLQLVVNTYAAAFHGTGGRQSACPSH
jgi:hypothetical protein